MDEDINPYSSSTITTTAINETQKKSTGEKVLDGIQLGLDVVGLIPGVGEIADLTNAGIYALRGDKVNAGLSLAASVPFVGSVATGAKLVTRNVNPNNGTVYGGQGSKTSNGGVTVIGGVNHIAMVITILLPLIH